jgi:hypothetical protein
MRNTRRALKASVVGIVVLFMSSCLVPCLGHTTSTIHPSLPTVKEKNTISDTAEITCYVIGLQGTQSKQKNTVSLSDAQWMITTLQSLKQEVARNPQSERIQNLQSDLLMFSEAHHLLPAGVSAKTVKTKLLKTPIISYKHLFSSPLLQGKASEWFCNFISVGDGSTLPIIILPRFIPFFVTPIPRAFIWWSTPNGYTSVGGLISNTGFIAAGEQKGIALGFWGIGFSIFLPPIHSYGLFGYALYSKVTAAQFEFWPPNAPPEITQTDPVDGQQMVSMSTSELRFNINDADGDLMSYNVTTQPNIGSGSGGLKLDGTYSIHISGLVSNTLYTWHVQVTDGKDTTEKTLTFTTEPIAPVITNLVPADGAQDVSIDTTQLLFTLKDYQGDAMEYTIETSPNIGSAHEVNVHDGTYTLLIHGITNGTLYRWYINVTDGQYWTRKINTFETVYPSQFDPFEYGWNFRKQITVDHSQVVGNLYNFPLLLNIVDEDLLKAQANGNDILFMNGTGVASKLFHEIEIFDASSGKLVVWINIPYISNTGDTIFYIYYRNTQCGNQQRQRSTWNSDYIGVWHFNQESGLVIDSTRQHNGTASSGVTEGIPGIIDGAFGFDGVSGFVDYVNMNRNVYDFSFWVKPTNIITPALPDTGLSLLSKTGTITIGAGFGDVTSLVTDETICLWSSPPDYRTAVTDLTISNTMFHLITFNWNSAENRYDIYYDSIQQSVTYGSSSGFLPLITVTDLGIGHDYPGSHGLFFNGCIDEARLVGVSHDAGWISTEYNNQKDPSTFLSVGPEVPSP